MDRRTASSLLTRRAQFIALGSHTRTLTARVRTGDLVAVAPGVYADSDKWRSFYSADRHSLRVFAQCERQRPGTVYALYSVAALHEIRLLGPYPDRVTTAVPPTSGGRSTGSVCRRHLRLADHDIVTIEGVRVTSPARTVIDLARELPFIQSVAMIDSARNHRRPLVTLDDLEKQLTAQSRSPGCARARAAVQFSTDLSDSVEESRSRVLLYQLGFPPPTLQHRLVLPEGTYYGDFWWEDEEHWGEFDGRQKYTDPELLNGRRPEDVVIAEKRREDAIRRNVRAFSRWGITENLHPEGLERILTESGLPRHAPRKLPS